LVAWARDVAASATRLDHWVLSTDDTDILEIGEALYPGCGLRRPAKLASNESPSIEYVRHALDNLEDGDCAFDAVTIIQATSPFTLPEDVDACVDLLESSGADSAVSVVKLAHDLHPAKMKVLNSGRLTAYLEEEGRRMAYQDLPEVFVRNGSVYAIARTTINRGEIIGADSRGWEMPRERSVDINEMLDLEWARFILERRSGPPASGKRSE
jgi:CMP-N-acetylneuraminic acid synthetase